MREADGWAVPAWAAVVIAASLVWKLRLDPGGPLWLDEAWTGAVVQAPGAAGFTRQLYWDVNPPLYFVLMRGCTALFGFSASALRAPSLLFAELTPLAPLLIPGTGLSRATRWAWAGVLAVWAPDLIFAHEARGYALVVLLEATASALYLRLLARTTAGRAWAWTAVSCLAMLTHYHASIVAGLEGLALLWLRPRAAVRCWPAALAFVPWLAWAAVHAPRLLQFARPEYAWYGVERGSEPLFDAAAYLAGGRLLWEGGLVLAALGALAHAWRGAEVGPAASGGVSAPERVAWALPAACLLGAALIVLGGYARPSFTLRYLLPFGPGALLGAVLLIRMAAPRMASALLPALMMVAVEASIDGLIRHDAFDRRDFNFEVASAWLAPSRPQRLVFLWDNPTARVLAPAQLSALGGFFLHRSGLLTEVDGLVPPRGADPNDALLAASAPAPGRPAAALIWMWDYKVDGTLANAADLRLDDLSRDRACRRFADGSLGVVACRAPGVGTSSFPPDKDQQP